MRNPILATMVVGVAVLLLTAPDAMAQQSAAQQKCLNALNKDGAAVAKEQGKESLACLKGVGTGKIPGSAQACLTADAKGKVAKRKGKTSADETKSCGTPPSFGYTSAATINAAAQQGELDLTADVYGANLDTAVIGCAGNKAGCQCQQRVSKTLEQLAALKLAVFVKCKKAALKNGANAAAALAACVNDAGTADSIAADAKGKIQKTIAGLDAIITKSCDTPGVTATAFPGDCTGLGGNVLTTCLDTRVECRVCQIVNEMDGIFVNCDLFDDGAANATCDSGTGPTPTPTATATPTPTTTPTFVPGAIFQGALPSTTGLFNFAAMIGVPGADAACNTNFPGSHACVVSELQAAAAASELALAVDVNGMQVTSFWGIDATRPPGQQCVSTPGPVPWDYATAHTGVFADALTLTNASGVLGPVIFAVCSQFRWVGCCL